MQLSGDELDKYFTDVDGYTIMKTGMANCVMPNAQEMASWLLPASRLEEIDPQI
jgi:hypothetical protein